jgi:hypothetical protein
MAVLLGCAVSLMTEGRLTPRLALPAAFYWSFVPLLQVGCVAVSYRRARSPRSLASAIDLFFTGTAPWMLWLAAYTSLWALAAPPRAYNWSGYHKLWYGLAILAGCWSAYIDFCYFRLVLGKAAAGAGGSLLFHRAVCWGVGLAVFVLPGGWQTVASWAGL